MTPLDRSPCSTRRPWADLSSRGRSPTWWCSCAATVAPCVSGRRYALTAATRVFDDAGAVPYGTVPYGSVPWHCVDEGEGLHADRIQQ